jgi:hypothetical protein
MGETLTVKSSILRRSLLAILVAAAPLGRATAQQPDQRGFGQQQQQEPQQEQQQLPPGQQHPQPQPRANPPPQAQHAAPPPSPAPPGQRPVQNTSPQFQRPAQTGVPPNTGAQNQGRQNAGPQPSGSTAPAAPQRPTGGQPPRGNPPPDRGRGETQNFAEHHGGTAPEQFNRGRFYGHDFDHFTPHEREIWHEGRWRHEFHDGRYGWWYDVDDVWYFYPEPIYPYPTFVPDIVYIPEVEEAPPPEIVSPPPSTYYYYYCDDAQAYYPYVASCDMPWRQVPATPPQ